MDFWFRSNLSRIIFFTVNFLLFFDQNHPWKCIGKNWNTKTSANFVTFCPFLNSLQPKDPEKPHQTPPKLILINGMKSSLWPFYVYGTLNLVLGAPFWNCSNIQNSITHSMFTFSYFMKGQMERHVQTHTDTYRHLQTQTDKFWAFMSRNYV